MSYLKTKQNEQNISRLTDREGTGVTMREGVRRVGKIGEGDKGAQKLQLFKLLMGMKVKHREYS